MVTDQQHSGKLMEGMAEVLSGQGFYAGICSLIIVGTGCYLLFSLRQYSQSPLNINILEIMALCFMLPVVLMLTISNDPPMEAVFGFLGTLAGYIFGKSSKEEK